MIFVFLLVDIQPCVYIIGFKVVRNGHMTDEGQGGTMEGINVSQQLKLLVDRYSKFMAPALGDEFDAFFTDVVKFVGPYPSIEALEKVVSYFKRKAESIVRTDIPCVLHEYGLSEAKIEDGSEEGIKVSIETYYETKQGDKGVLVPWLESKGLGEIVKDSLQFSRGDFTPELEGYLKEKGYSYTRDSTINGQTLKKHIKDYLNAGGEPPPKEAMSIDIFQAARIVFPKERTF